MTEQLPPAGWYPWEDMVDTVRYWNGTTWTSHYGPVQATARPPAPPTSENPQRACPYCGQPIAEDAARCNHCSGELRYCPKDKQMVGLTSRQMFVGVLRGGTKTQYSCMLCGRTLDGPRF